MLRYVMELEESFALITEDAQPRTVHVLRFLLTTDDAGKGR